MSADDARKEVFNAISSGDAKLKSTGTSAADSSMSRAKVLSAVTKKDHGLKHVDAPDGGLTEEQKAAYLKEKEEAGK